MTPAFVDCPEGFDWWHSGALWYCRVSNTKAIRSGCGPSREDAVRDATKECVAYSFKKKSHSESGVQE